MKEKQFKIVVYIVILIAMVVAFIFCMQKQGMHYDENYSYYSTNVTYGLYPTDGEWKSVEEIKNEFKALPGDSLNFSGVKLSQSYDVHPPLYYYILRIVCWFTKDTFSMWQGLAINLVFYLICLILLWKISDLVSKNNQFITLFTIILFALSPGYLSTITFIRMYVMLTAACFYVLYIGLKAVNARKYTAKNLFIPTFIATCLGFLTHYYFAVFMFWVAAYLCIYLFVNKETRKKAFIYAGCVVAGMGAAIAYYPACLAHIFGGYRGLEATEAFKDVSNTFERIDFFTQMLNDFTFSGSFFALLIIVLLIYLFMRFKKKSGEALAFGYNRGVVGMLMLVTIMFFLTVCKTGMIPSNPQEALRYPCPAYGLIILLIVMGVVNIKKWQISTAILSLAIICQIVGLCQGKVFFIYPEKISDYEFSDKHKDSEIVYLYNPNNEWMVWNDSLELMNYKDIFFMNYLSKDDIKDERLLNSTSMYVYACRADESQKLIQKLVDADENFNEYEKVEERTYVDIYELK